MNVSALLLILHTEILICSVYSLSWKYWKPYNNLEINEIFLAKRQTKKQIYWQ